jgi:hypothetical protein
MNLEDIKVGDLFSETNHMICVSVRPYSFEHLESGKIVDLSPGYINLLTPADQWDEEIKVGLEDKKSGEKGIRSIWEDIKGTQVFTVCYTKQNETLSEKAYQERVKKELERISANIIKAKEQRKSVVNVASREIEKLIKNPILDYVPGEERILRGYKKEWESRDGHYKCYDVDKRGIREVNIKSLKWIIFNNKKYTYEV